MARQEFPREASLSAAPITCVITSYNNATTIRAAITSVMRQTMPVSEIIVADDRSTDGTQELLTDLAGQFPNVRLMLRPKNLGVAANRDLAIRAAAEPFVTHLDGDDLFAPYKIEKEWSILGGVEDEVAYSYIARISMHRMWRWAVIDPRTTVTGTSAVVLSRILSRRSPIPRDMLLSKALFIEAGGFQHGVQMYEDWQFKMRLATVARKWRHSETLGTLYMDRTGSLSNQDRSKHQRWQARVVRDNFGLLETTLGTKTLGQAIATFLGPQFGHIASTDLACNTLKLFASGKCESWSSYPQRRRYIEQTRLRLRLLRFIPEIRKALKSD